MAEPIRFFFDQHYPFPVVQALRQRGIDVLTMQEAGRCGLPDADQLQFATDHQRVMVTFDSDYLALHGQGIRHAGIIWSPMLKHSVGVLIHLLVLMHGVMEPDEMKEHVEYL